MSIEEFLALPEDRQIVPETLNRLSYDNLIDLLNMENLSETVIVKLESELNLRTEPLNPNLSKEVPAKKSELPGYPALTVLTLVLKIFGYGLILFGIIIFFSAAAKKDTLIPEEFSAIMAVTTALTGVFSIVIAELISVFVDISKNTAAILKRLEK